VIKELLGEPVGRPVVHSPGAQANPFGPTWFFGYEHVVFEVMKSNGHLASVCLFAE
jgi:phagosome assembly factor 1